MAEVVFRWLEIKSDVKWVDVATLCEQTGFNHISEAINNAYISGMHDAHISFAYIHSSDANKLFPSACSTFVATTAGKQN